MGKFLFQKVMIMMLSTRAAFQSKLMFIGTSAFVAQSPTQLSPLRRNAIHVMKDRMVLTSKYAFLKTVAIATSSNAKYLTKLNAASTQQTLSDVLTEDNKTYYEAEQVIKKSRFIGIAKHCTSWETAQEFIKSIRDEHPKARHVCFGFVCGTNPVTERASDDGEPTGTAGSPILGGINGEELSDTVCVVVRYSGGIKLGAGGLIRAYGGTARLVLRVAERDILIPMSQVKVWTRQSNAGSIYATATRYGGSVQGECYKDNGDIEASIICETEILDTLIEEIRDATKGDARFDMNNS